MEAPFAFRGGVGDNDGGLSNLRANARKLREFGTCSLVLVGVALLLPF